MIGLYCALAGISVACLTWWLFSTVGDVLSGGEAIARGEVESSSLLFRMIRPFARAAGFVVANISASIEMRVGRDAKKSYLLRTRIRAEKALLSAGHPQGFVADEFIGLVIVSVIGFVGVVVLLGMFVSSAFFSPAMFVSAVLLGALTPILWLRDQMRRRQNSIRRALPYALDLLTLAVEAGLDFTAALSRISERMGRAPLADEFRLMLREIQLGKGRSEALRDLSRRVGIAELSSVVSALIQAEELGASLGPTLRIQAEQMRIQRSQRAEKLAMEAPIKILFPLIAFIFPTTFVMIFGPILLKFMFQR